MFLVTFGDDPIMGPSKSVVKFTVTFSRVFEFWEFFMSNPKFCLLFNPCILSIHVFLFGSDIL